MNDKAWYKSDEKNSTQTHFKIKRVFVFSGVFAIRAVKSHIATKAWFGSFCKSQRKQT